MTHSYSIRILGSHNELAVRAVCWTAAHTTRSILFISDFRWSSACRCQWNAGEELCAVRSPDARIEPNRIDSHDAPVSTELPLHSPQSDVAHKNRQKWKQSLALIWRIYASPGKWQIIGDRCSSVLFQLCHKSDRLTWRELLRFVWAFGTERRSVVVYGRTALFACDCNYNSAVECLNIARFGQFEISML